MRRYFLIYNAEKVIVTGKSGYIGKSLPSDWLSLDRDINSTDLFRDFNSLQDFSLIHLAAVVGAEKVNKFGDLAYKINVNGALNTARQAVSKKLSRFFFISSSHVYGKSEFLLNERSYLNPINAYAEQKLLAENQLIEFFTKVECKLVILRIFSVLDWRMPENTLGHKIEQALKFPSKVVRFGLDKRDFIDLRSLANVFKALIQQNYDDSIINVCTGHARSINEVTNQFFVQSDSLIKPKIRLEFSENPFIVGSGDKLKTLIGDKYLYFNLDKKYIKHD